ncbi:MAG: transketolase [Oscillospiraceae bacterium]
MDEKLVKQLEIAAVKIRMGIIEGVHSAKAGHPGGSLSCADLLAYLYMHRLNVDPADPKCPTRDRMVMSKGHAAPALYATLALRGFFPMEEMKTLRKNGARLQGHPDSKKIPGVDCSTGSLGQGISAACGMALSGKISCDSYKVYAILGDGEIEEGIVWEAAMFAAHYMLDNLVAVVDNNNLQIDGKITEVMSPYPIDEKFKAFGWHVINIDGHDFNQMEKAFDEAEKVVQKPTVIIMKTTKGKGVDYMENSVDWHGKAPGDEDYERAMKQLREQLAELEGSVD